MSNFQFLQLQMYIIKPYPDSPSKLIYTWPSTTIYWHLPYAQFPRIHREIKYARHLLPSGDPWGVLNDSGQPQFYCTTRGCETLSKGPYSKYFSIAEVLPWLSQLLLSVLQRQAAVGLHVHRCPGCASTQLHPQTQLGPQSADPVNLHCGIFSNQSLSTVLLSACSRTHPQQMFSLTPGPVLLAAFLLMTLGLL